MKLPSFKKDGTIFFLVMEPRDCKKKKEKKRSVCCSFDAGTRFLSTFFFHISVYKKFCLLFTMGLVLHFEVNKRICIA